MFLLRSLFSSTIPDMENAPEEIPLRLRWRQTWEDKEADYVAEAPTYKGTVGRIYYVPEHHGPQEGRWFWAFQAFGDHISRNVGKLTGHEDSARAAARQVENAWFLAIKGTAHDRPTAEPSPANTYAAAKGR